MMEPQLPTTTVKVAYCAIWVVVLAYSAGCYYLLLNGALT